ncbi:glycosyltransferase [Diaminobutyricimonas sp. LJ205]|uniref:glycosyltransferase n=1 Tax=Diaminobutyricimonas sp. LJ205 TaxID=2683590 RepID=UPI0012F4AC61|nr:glycosyltransferase [Diaminobutyricimonas sp. LJ205]
MSDSPHTVSVVIPVYQGEKTLAGVLAEIAPLAVPISSPGGNQYVVTEVLLVHDNGPDHSDDVMRALDEKYDFVRPLWLSKNYGQHAATLAGMASSGGDWVVSLDEDGQHDPAAIGSLLDTALRERASIVYAKPTNEAPHGFMRNSASKLAKWMLTKLAGGGAASDFQSYRLMLGSLARSVAAYSGSGVYLDIALGWMAGKVTTSPVTLREEGDRPSGYSMRRLFSHFWRMVISSGTRGLRLVSLIGAGFGLAGIAVAIYILVARLTSSDVPEGWASTIVVILISAGAILFALGIIAEYIGVNVNMAMGKPPYLIVSDPANGPLGRGRQERPSPQGSDPASQ